MKSKSTQRNPKPAAALGYAYSVRAEMIDGSTLDLLLFGDQQAANDHVAYIRNNCRLLGYDSLTGHQAADHRQAERDSDNITRYSSYRYVAYLSPSSRMRFVTRIVTLPPVPRKRWRHSLVIRGRRAAEP
jgi:hypothetical protein